MSLPIVEDFDVNEDGVGQFKPGLSLLSIEQLVLVATPTPRSTKRSSL